MEKAGDLVNWTYFMLDWTKVSQRPSGTKCSDCGKELMLGEAAEDPGGNRFDCYVCHNDKRVFWVKSR